MKELSDRRQGKRKNRMCKYFTKKVETSAFACMGFVPVWQFREVPEMDLLIARKPTPPETTALRHPPPETVAHLNLIDEISLVAFQQKLNIYFYIAFTVFRLVYSRPQALHEELAVAAYSLLETISESDKCVGNENVHKLKYQVSRLLSHRNRPNPETIQNELPLHQTTGVE
jgi:hypothetical protein